MTPEQFLAHVQRGPLAPAYLFLGPEEFQRDACRRALVEKVLPREEWESGITRHDLDETGISAVMDDACALSLFAPRRLLWIGRAEAAVPRGNETIAVPPALASYVRNPTPGVTMVFDSARYDFEGEDKTKQERVRKFYAPLPVQVEFTRWSSAQARKFAQDLVRETGLRIAPDDLTLLVEAVGSAPARIATEIEKLRLYAGEGGQITSHDIARLVPQAQATTIFALVNALGRNDRKKALDLLDVLIREGEYLPLALSFLATQFRQALVAQEAQLRSAGQVQGHFQKLGVPMWPSRAEQVVQTMNGFSASELRAAIKRIARTDAALRDIRPDDRVVLEDLVVNLTR
ncbi:MAG: DNA polymerase III subunit delta [Bryobacterales bacterium]|nr:DNA polymerase III subunit delta [Bryobacterales bacterium]